MNGTIATPYTPRGPAGRAIINAAIAGTLSRPQLAAYLRELRRSDWFGARHLLAWIDWLGGYPLKGYPPRELKTGLPWLDR